MDLTAANLVEALAVCSGKRSEDVAKIVEIARKTEPSFCATLYSAWQAEGMHLSPALREELAATTRRVEFYREVAARLRAELPSFTTIKGLEVAALYPPGLVRYMSDLDLITFSEPDLWWAVSLLMADGWSVDTATFAHLGGSLRMMVGMRMPAEDPFSPVYEIELANYYTLGNRGSIPPIVKMPSQWLNPPVKNMIMLLHERYEQPFRVKDVVDAALLHRSMREPDRRALHDAVVSLGLVLAYSELIKLVNDAGLGPLPPLPGGSLTIARATAMRLARGASFFARPLTGTARHLQRRLITGKPGRAENVVWELVERHLHPATALRAGLLGFGLAISGPNPDMTRAVLRQRGDYAWVDTPACRFLLTLGDFVSETAVEELSGDDAETNLAGTDLADRETGS